jgi:serine/threonine protein kinase
MSPEQARGRTADVGPHSDIYSAGAILYHLLALVAPYDTAQGNARPREILERVLAGPPIHLQCERHVLPPS